MNLRVHRDIPKTEHPGDRQYCPSGNDYRLRPDAAAHVRISRNHINAHIYNTHKQSLYFIIFSHLLLKKS